MNAVKLLEIAEAQKRKLKAQLKKKDETIEILQDKIKELLSRGQ